jgi:alpha,alpha-trehalase
METSVITHHASSGARAGEPSQPVANYSLLADCNSAALVDREGSIAWLYLPRYDSDAIFSRLLDPDAGHWSIRPTGSFTAERRYLPGTLVVETIFTTDSGQVRLTDAMAFAEGQRGHDLGHDAPHEQLRSVEGISGEVELRLELAPRPQYGLIKPLVRLEDGGARTFGAGRLRFSVRWAPPESRDAPEPTAPNDVSARIADTVEGWRSWEVEHDIYDGPHRELVRMSSRVLKGLSYRPTGAIVAAPTTSLPETVGGERNWDYRFSWIRDSSLRSRRSTSAPARTRPRSSSRS